MYPGTRLRRFVSNTERVFAPRAAGDFSNGWGQRSWDPASKPEELVNGDRRIAVGAQAASAQPAHEAATFAALGAELTSFTSRALIDGPGRHRTGLRGQLRRRGGDLVTATPQRLAAAVRAGGPVTAGRQRACAHQAKMIRYVTVT